MPRGADSGAVLRILFVMNHAGYVRNFESVLRILTKRGHRVHVAFDREADITTDVELVEQLRGEQELLTFGRSPLAQLAKGDPILRGAAKVRRSVDYLPYLEPMFADASKLRARAAQGVPSPIVALARLRATRRLARRTLSALDAAAPAHPEIVRFVAGTSPDVLLITSLVEMGSSQPEYLRAARALGIPSIYAVASWDNLTTKGTVHVLPDQVSVWNDEQRREAVELHAIPEERIVVTGAIAYDHWFDWAPSLARAAFCARAGLPDARPFVLYLGSSPFIAPRESDHVACWLRAIRADARTAGLAVVIRPHPANPLLGGPDGADLAALVEADGLAVVYPPSGRNPTSPEARNTYFDSLYYAAAAVGVNTSGLVEGAIVGCPVLVLQPERYRATQEGTPHFRLLGDAITATARDEDEHLRQLAEAVTASREPHTQFLRTFVRPGGVDVPAATQFADAVEVAASFRPKPSRPSRPRAAAAGRILQAVGTLSEPRRGPRQRRPRLSTPEEGA